MTSTGDVETRAAIKFCVGLGKTPTQTHTMIKEGLKRKCSRSLVFKWHERFRNGRESIEDDVRCGRVPVVKQSVTEKVRERIREDRLTIRSIAERLGVSFSVVQEIITKDLNMSKVSARWVSRLLSAEDKAKRVERSEEFLRRHITLTCPGQQTVTLFMHLLYFLCFILCLLIYITRFVKDYTFRKCIFISVVI